MASDRGWQNWGSRRAELAPPKGHFFLLNYISRGETRGFGGRSKVVRICTAIPCANHLTFGPRPFRMIDPERVQAIREINAIADEQSDLPVADRRTGLPSWQSSSCFPSTTLEVPSLKRRLVLAHRVSEIIRETDAKDAWRTGGSGPHMYLSTLENGRRCHTGKTHQTHPEHHLREPPNVPSPNEPHPFGDRYQT